MAETTGTTVSNADSSSVATPAPNAGAVVINSPFPVPTGAQPQRAVTVDVVQQSKLADTIAGEWQGALQDIMKIGKEQAAAFAKVYAPTLAHQALLMQSPDSVVAQNARVNLRHLRGQLIMRAGEAGVVTQQRFEQAFLATIDRALKAIA